MMRILIYGLNFAPELTGIGKYSGEMAEYLAEKGHSVRVITTPPYYPEWRIQAPYSGAGYQKEVWKGVMVWRCPLWLPPKAGSGGRINGLQRILYLLSFALSSLPPALAQISWKPERVIVIAPSILNAPLGALIAGVVGAPSWLHIQDFELEAALGLKLLPGMGWIVRLAMKAEAWLYRRFKRVSTISNRMVERLQMKGVSAGKTVLFPNWVDTRRIYPQQGYNDLRRKLGIDASCTVILYSGNMGQKQGLEVLVEAARILEHEKSLIFLLSGAGAVKSQLEEQARGLANLRFLPLQPVEGLNDLLNLADIHVLPQSASAADLVMPSKLSGMLASGRPVIATAVPGTELATVMEGIGRVVPPGQAEPLAEAILSLAHNPEERSDFGRRGHAYAVQTWARETVLEKFMQTLQAL